jgi:hypothetical protein
MEVKAGNSAQPDPRGERFYQVSKLMNDFKASFEEVHKPITMLSMRLDKYLPYPKIHLRSTHMKRL